MDRKHATALIIRNINDLDDEPLKKHLCAKLGTIPPIDIPSFMMKPSQPTENKPRHQHLHQFPTPDPFFSHSNAFINLATHPVNFNKNSETETNPRSEPQKHRLHLKPLVRLLQEDIPELIRPISWLIPLMLGPNASSTILQQKDGKEAMADLPSIIESYITCLLGIFNQHFDQSESSQDQLFMVLGERCRALMDTEDVYEFSELIESSTDKELGIIIRDQIIQHLKSVILRLSSTPTYRDSSHRDPWTTLASSIRKIFQESESLADIFTLVSRGNLEISK